MVISKKKRILYIIIIILLIVLTGMKWVLNYKNSSAYHFGYSDYYFFYYSFDNIWHGKPPSLLYNCEFLRKEALEKHGLRYRPTGCFLYPPQFALFFSWLASFSYRYSEIVWNIMVNVVYISGVVLFVKTIVQGFKKEWIIATILVLLGLIQNPFLYDFHTSSSNRLTFFLIALMFFFHYKKKKDFLAGIFLGLSIVFRVTPAIIFVFYLFKKKTKIIVGSLISGIASTIVVIPFIGWDVFWKYVTKDFWSVAKGLESYEIPYDNSLQGILQKYAPKLPDNMFFYTYIVLLLLLYMYMLWKNKNQNVEMFLIALSPILFSPHLEIFHIILGLFSQIILTYYLWHNRGKFLKTINWIIFYIFTFITFWNTKGEYFGVLILFLISIVIIFKKENNFHLKKGE